MDLTGMQLGNYQLIQPIGSGGMGEVFLAQDIRINRQVAIKVMRNEPTAYPNVENMQKVERLFQREMRIISRFDHPHILPVFDFGEEKIGNDRFLYMVMPYREEGSLVDWLQRRSTTSFIPPQDVIHFVKQAADALQTAHDIGVVHQDVKPSNFLVRNRREQPEHPDLLLTDFGIAKVMNATVTTGQSVRGTSAYMSPEHWKGQPVPATDQYALAIMVCELLTGKTPFQGGTMQVMYKHLQESPTPPSQLNPQLSINVDQVILKALEKEPEQRFASVMDFALSFQRSIENEPSTFTYSVDEISPIAPAERVEQGAQVAPTERADEVSLVAPTERADEVSLVAPTERADEVSLVAPTEREYAESMAVTISNPIQKTPIFLTSTPSSLRSNKSGMPNSRKVLLKRYALSITMACLIIMTGVLAFSTYQGNVRQANSDATAIARTNATSVANAKAIAGVTATAVANATASANATATEVANAQVAANETATAIANATATVVAENPYPPYLLGSGTLAFSDPLTQSGALMERRNGSFGGACVYEYGAFHVVQSITPRMFHCPSSESFGNVAFEVQMTIMAGNCGGVTFREFQNQLYTFRVCQNGYYNLTRDTLNSYNSIALIPASYTSDINQGFVSVNVIDVIANDSSISVYINGQLLNTVNDSILTEGPIGVIAGASNAQTEVAYQNLKVWNI